MLCTGIHLDLTFGIHIQWIAQPPSKLKFHLPNLLWFLIFAEIPQTWSMKFCTGSLTNGQACFVLPIHFPQGHKTKIYMHTYIYYMCVYIGARAHIHINIYSLKVKASQCACTHEYFIVTQSQGCLMFPSPAHSHMEATYNKKGRLNSDFCQKTLAKLKSMGKEKKSAKEYLTFWSSTDIPFNSVEPPNLYKKRTQHIRRFLFFVTEQCVLVFISTIILY